MIYQLGLFWQLVAGQKVQAEFFSNAVTLWLWKEQSRITLWGDTSEWILLLIHYDWICSAWQMAVWGLFLLFFHFLVSYNLGYECHFCYSHFMSQLVKLKKKPFSKSVTFQLGLCEFMLNPKVRIWFYYWNVSPYVIWKCSGLLGEFLFSLSFSFSIITIRGTGNSPTFNPGSLSAMINGSSAQCSLRCRFQHCSLDT